MWNVFTDFWSFSFDLCGWTILLTSCCCDLMCNVMGCMLLPDSYKTCVLAGSWRSLLNLKLDFLSHKVLLSNRINRANCLDSKLSYLVILCIPPTSSKWHRDLQYAECWASFVNVLHVLHDMLSCKLKPVYCYGICQIEKNQADMAPHKSLTAKFLILYVRDTNLHSGLECKNINFFTAWKKESMFWTWC